MKPTLYQTGSRILAGFLGGAFLLAASSLAWNRHAIAGETARLTPVALNVSDTPISREDHFTTSFAPIIKKVAPSVVMIDITTKSKTVAAPESPLGNDELLRRFFGNQSEQGGRGNRTYHTPKEY